MHSGGCAGQANTIGVLERAGGGRIDSLYRRDYGQGARLDQSNERGKGIISTMMMMMMMMTTILMEMAMVMETVIVVVVMLVMDGDGDDDRAYDSGTQDEFVSVLLTAWICTSYINAIPAFFLGFDLPQFLLIRACINAPQQSFFTEF